ncbi:MAG: hypothetical protein DRH17_11145 [Deltaproteobacteria bacterium]|nr:MAG: hypothetical protein DRH17_11145 [Deltaproteobacteria bacterium]
MDDAYRRYVKFFAKENDLVKNRLAWLFASQTLIFGAFQYGAFIKQNILIIAVVGATSSFLLGLSIFAAVVSYFLAQRKLDNLVGEKGLNYPEVGRKRWVLFLGFLGSLGLPIMFSVCWLVVIIKNL